MTTIDHNLREMLPPAATHMVQVMWSSTGGRRSDARAVRLSKVEFILQIETFSADRGTIEAWIQSGGDRVPVLHATPVRVMSHADGQALHLDAVRFTGATNERIAAVSMWIENGKCSDGGRIIYAQTALLATAGFPAGSYDPPTIKGIA